MQTSPYQRLSNEERESISRRLAQKISIRLIAREMERSPSTVAREIKRNIGKTGYRAFTASQRAKVAASSRKKGKSRIAQQETLRQEHKYRRKQKRGKGEENRGKIANMLSIEERPAEVADRTVQGHWEGDLILGKYKRSALGILVERTTRYTILLPLGDQKDALSVREAYAKAFKTVPDEPRKTPTYDQGKEMSQPERFTIDTGTKVFFAHPGSPWERGTNENTNGLIRQ